MTIPTGSVPRVDHFWEVHNSEGWQQTGAVATSAQAWREGVRVAREFLRDCPATFTTLRVDGAEVLITPAISYRDTPLDIATTYAALDALKTRMTSALL